MPKSCIPIVRIVGGAARQLLALVLAFAVAIAAGPETSLFAQVPTPGPATLRITILDGEDSLNNIRERTAREPIVQVEDENHKPVAGALLLFSIQNGGTGAGGTFNGLSTLSVTTGADGRGIAHGLKPNGKEGAYTISVTATLGALLATAIIHQSNLAGGGAPGVPANPVTPANPGTPVGTGTPSPSVPSPASGDNPAPTNPGAPPVTRVRTGVHRIPKKVWITGTAIIITGVVAGIIASGGNNPTTITPGAGTVGP